MQEKRRHPRVPIQHHLQYAAYRLFEEPALEVSSSLNLSESGIAFLSKKNYQKQDLVFLRINLPGWEKEKTEFLKPNAVSSFEPLSMLVQVRWSKKVRSAFEVGAEIVTIDPDHRKALKKFLKKQSSLK